MGTRLFRAALAPALAALPLLAGCLGYTYEEADIRSVLTGSVPSHSSRYRLPAPEIPILRKNIGIVREGGLFAMIVGPDLRSAVTSYAGEGVEYGVVFRREPLRHVLLERVWVNGKEIELAGVGEFRYRLPDLVGVEDVPREEYAQDDSFRRLRPRDTAGLHSAVGRDMFVTGFHVRERDLPDELRDTDLVRAANCPPEKLKYFLTSNGSDYLLCDHDPMTALMLDYLIAENREFQGGIHVAGIFEPEPRNATGISGMVDVRWMALGGPMYFRSH